MLHSGLVVFYILMIYLILSDFYTSFNQIYLYIVYFGMGLCIMSDLYLQYEIRQPKAESKIPRTISIDPSKPFSNVIALQDQLFPNMNGHLKIVDKHFNSAALQNFHRIAEKSMQNFTKVTILTSKEMLDSGFGQYVSDLRSELSGAGVGLEIKLMDDKDTVDQHERIMLDDKIAYKIPPFNIINKRSEHITRISHEEANKRFQYLFNRSIKLENYSVKRARDGEEK